MSKAVYFGVSSKARKVKKIYIGIGGKARKVKKGYIGIGGKARLFFSSGAEKGFYRFWGRGSPNDISGHRSILQRLDLATYAQRSEINSTWAINNMGPIAYYNGVFYVTRYGYVYDADPSTMDLYHPRIMDPHTCADLGESTIVHKDVYFSAASTEQNVVSNIHSNGNRTSYYLYAGSPLAVTNSSLIFTQRHYSGYNLAGGGTAKTFVYIGRASSSTDGYLYEIEAPTGTSVRGSWKHGYSGHRQRTVTTASELYLGFSEASNVYNRSSLALIKQIKFVMPSKFNEWFLNSNPPAQIMVDE